MNIFVSCHRRRLHIAADTLIILLCCLFLAAGISGCVSGLQKVFLSGQKDSIVEKNKARLILSLLKNYYVWECDGKIYILGQAPTNRFFKKNKHLTNSRILPGAGPDGQDVVFEFDPYNPELTQRLIKSYLGGPHLLDKLRNRYFVWRYDNTIYVVGNSTTDNYFQLYRQLPYSKTFKGFGPDGEDVIFEVDPKVRGLTSRLVEQFQRGPRLTYSWKNELFIWRYLDDIYVIGKPETCKIFKTGPDDLYISLELWIVLSFIGHWWVKISEK